MTLKLLRHLLALIYFSNSGTQWCITKNWISQEPACAWHGMSLEIDRNEISKVHLSSNNLKGNMIPEIGKFRELECHAFDSNGLEVLIPKEIFKAENLLT